MSEQPRTWAARNWVGIGIVTGIVLFFIALGIALWLGILEFVVPIDGQETAPPLAFVLVAAVVVAAVGWLWKLL